jgi:hypothetical protein
MVAPGARGPTTSEKRPWPAGGGRRFALDSSELPNLGLPARRVEALGFLRCPSGDLKESWERTRSHLARAWALLPAGDDDNVSQYQELLDHNELGLAMEVLGEVGEQRSAPGEFWVALTDAARNMRLDRRRRSTTVGLAAEGEPIAVRAPWRALARCRYACREPVARRHRTYPDGYDPLSPTTRRG